jgi:hypothetical protein
MTVQHPGTVPPSPPPPLIHQLLDIHSEESRRGVEVAHGGRESALVRRKRRAHDEEKTRRGRGDRDGGWGTAA